MKINIDPNELTADVDKSNDSWPKKVEDSQFDNFEKSSTSH